MGQTTDWTRSYLASATLGRERHTDSARVTTAQYPQEELFGLNVELLRATSASDEMGILIRTQLVSVKLLLLVTDIPVSICCVNTVVFDGTKDQNTVLMLTF